MFSVVKEIKVICYIINIIFPHISIGLHKL